MTAGDPSPLDRLDDRLGRIEARLSRIEGGLVLAAFLTGITVTLIASHTIKLAW